MLFLNAALLVGLLAVAVPILIHLLNRKSARTLEWGAIQFLLDSLVIRRRRILLEEVLLLVARCLLVALAVLAVARPFVPAASRVPWGVVLPAVLGAVMMLGASVACWRYPRWRWGLTAAGVVALLVAAGAVLWERWGRSRGVAGGGRQDLAIVIDGSDSMRVAADGRTLFDRAVDEAAAVIEQAPAGCTFSIVLGTDVPQRRTPAPTADRRALRELLAQLEPPGGTMRVLESFTAAVRCLSDGLYPAKQIVLIGDAQRYGWELDQPARWELFKSVLTTLPAPPQVIVRALPGRPAFRNAAVTGLRVGRGIVGVGRDVEVEVRVENTGTEAVTPGSVTLHAGGTQLVDRTLGLLEPGAAASVRFRHRFAEPGAHPLRAEVASADDLVADNARESVKHVVAAIPVLVVSGGAGASILDRAGVFESLALAPSEATAEALQPERRRREGQTPLPPRPGDCVLQPELIEAAEFGSAVDLARYGVVVLADVPVVPAEAGQRLEQFVRAGGGLLVTAGTRVQPEVYNTWRQEDGEPMLPAAIGASRATPDGAVTLSPETFGHAAVAWLSGRRGDLAETRIMRYWQLAPGDAARGVSVCARLTSGDPYLLERQVGRGSVMLLATALSPQDSDIITRRSFVPLVNELAHYLARSAETRLNLRPAPELVLQLAGVGGSAGLGGGLLGEYFADRQFGQRVLTRFDTNVNFAWSGAAPGPGVPADNFSARWTGTLVPPRTGTYKFEAECDDRLALWLDRKRVLNAQAWQNREGTAYLKAGEAVRVRIEFGEESGEARARLLWTLPKGGTRVPVPPEVFSPDLSALPGAMTAGMSAQGPDGEPRPVRLESRERSVLAVVGGHVMPGVFRLALPEPVARLLGRGGARARDVAFAVERDPEESRLAARTGEDLQFVRKYVEVEQPESLDQLRLALAGQVTGRELWTYLAVAALFLLVAEIGLAWWIAWQRRMGLEEKVDFEGYLGPSATFRDQVARVKGGRDTSIG